MLVRIQPGNPIYCLKKEYQKKHTENVREWIEKFGDPYRLEVVKWMTEQRDFVQSKIENEEEFKKWLGSLSQEEIFEVINQEHQFVQGYYHIEEYEVKGR